MDRRRFLLGLVTLPAVAVVAKTKAPAAPIDRPIAVCGNSSGSTYTEMSPCRFTFKDRGCGYVGPLTGCDKTVQDCAARGNLVRFGGFPDVRVRQFIRSHA